MQKQYNLNKATTNLKEQAMFKLDSTDQLSEKLEKLKAYGQALRGKELQLQEKERQLMQKELQLKLFRKNILLAIKEQLTENGQSYEDTVKILEKYRDILQYIAKDVESDLDEIMG
jgi:hypothetical protein